MTDGTERTVQTILLLLEWGQWRPGILRGVDERPDQRVVRSNRKSFRQRGTGMGYQRLVTRDQLHEGTWSAAQWAVFLVVLAAALAGLAWWWVASG